MVYEEGESLRWLSPKERTKFTNEGAEDFFPTTPESAPFAYKGFHTINPSSYGTSMTVTGGIFEADKVKKIKVISSLCGYPDQGGGGLFYGVFGGGMGAIGGLVIGGLLAGFIIGMAVAGPGMVVGMLVGMLVGGVIGALYGWYKSNQIDKKITEEKKGYSLVEEKSSSERHTVEPILSPVYTPPRDVFPEKKQRPSNQPPKQPTTNVPKR